MMIKILNSTVKSVQEASHWSAALSLFATLPRRRVALDSFGYTAVAPRKWRESSWLMQVPPAGEMQRATSHTVPLLHP